MKIVKFQRVEKVNWGILENDKVFELRGNLYAEFKRGKEICNIEEVRLLAPVEPTIMVCCGMNYMERFKENYIGEAGLKLILFT